MKTEAYFKLILQPRSRSVNIGNLPKKSNFDLILIFGSFYLNRVSEVAYLHIDVSDRLECLRRQRTIRLNLLGICFNDRRSEKIGTGFLISTSREVENGFGM